MNPTPFQQWLEEQREKAGSWNALAIRFGVPSPYVLRWRDGGLPERERLIELARISGTPVEALERMMMESAGLRWRARRSRLAHQRSGGTIQRRPLTKAGRVPFPEQLVRRHTG